MSRAFYELCYDQYKQEMKEADSLYQKGGVVILAVSLLGTILSALGRVDLLPRIFDRVDVFFFYAAFAVAGSSLVVSVIFLFLCVYPRQYHTLAGMDVWFDWREKYRRFEEEKGDAAESPPDLDGALFENICPKLVEAQPKNAAINEKRRTAFRWSILWSATALAATGVQAFFNMLLLAQGL